MLLYQHAAAAAIAKKQAYNEKRALRSGRLIPSTAGHKNKKLFTHTGIMINSICRLAIMRMGGRKINKLRII
jgi:hypothetical protein